MLQLLIYAIIFNLIGKDDPPDRHLCRRDISKCPKASLFNVYPVNLDPPLRMPLKPMSISIYQSTHLPTQTSSDSSIRTPPHPDLIHS